MPLDKRIRKVLMIGSGPIVIGQAAEFDYAGAQACRVLKAAGVNVVLVNSNPATIMTDRAPRRRDLSGAADGAHGQAHHSARKAGQHARWAGRTDGTDDRHAAWTRRAFSPRTACG